MAVGSAIIGFVGKKIGTHITEATVAVCSRVESNIQCRGAAPAGKSRSFGGRPRLHIGAKACWAVEARSMSSSTLLPINVNNGHLLQ